MTPLEFDALAQSGCIALATVLLCLPGALAAASWMGRRPRRGVWAINALLLLPMSLSPVLVGWGVVALLAPDRVGRARGPAAEPHGDLLIACGLVLAATCLVLPLMIRILRPAFEVADHQMVLTARTLGASRWDAWWSVTATQTAPMVVAACALGFAAAWGEAGGAVVIAALLQSQGLPAGHGAPSVPLTLLSALQTERGVAIAGRLAVVSVAVALAAALAGEWARQRWRRKALPRDARGHSA